MAPIQPFRFWLLCGLLVQATALFAKKPSASMISATVFQGFEAMDGRSEYWLGVPGVGIRFKPGGTVVLEVPGDSPQADLEFVGADPSCLALGEDIYAAPVRYYLGPAQQWRSAVRYRRIRYRQLYPGVDLVFRLSEQGFEFDIEVAPDADVHQVRVRWNGVTNLTLDNEGAIVARADQIQIRQAPPKTLQKEAGRNQLRRIPSSYHVTSQNVVELDLAGYDHRSSLTLDPTVVVSTHVGGSGIDAIYGTAVDTSGSIYVVGETSSADFRGKSITSADAFVMKLDPTGTRIIYLTFLGGGAYDSARAIAVDSQGNAYVTGITNSNDFPVASALQGSSGGPPDAFVAKLTASGQVAYSTYLGGAGADYGYGIAVDNSGAAYVSGQTASISLATTAGVVQQNFGGGLSDCFVAKLNAVGSALSYMTFLGGSALDVCTSIAVDTTGNTIVAGTTSSGNFPLASPVQSSLQGSSDAFVAALNASGSALLFSTYLGGNSVDAANSVAVDSSHNIFVSGTTASSDFPTTAGAFQIAEKGTYNAFVCKLPQSGLSVTYCTLIGGEGTDTVTSIAVGPTGEAILGGYTTSTQFPTAQATQASFGGAVDGFISMLNPSGTGLEFSTYQGGSGDDRVYSVAANATTIYAGGWTSTAGSQLDGLLTAISGLPITSVTSIRVNA